MIALKNRFLTSLLPLTLCLGIYSTSAFADTELILLPIDDVLNMPEASKRLDPSIKMSFAQTIEGEIVKDKVTSSRRTDLQSKGPRNCFPSDGNECYQRQLKEAIPYACRWAMLSSLLSLQNGARKAGANSISNIVSNYQKEPFDTKQRQYECRIGAVMVNVALTGSFVTSK